MAVNLIGLNEFILRFSKESVVNNKPRRKFVWLIGAGVSVSSGIPLAEGVSDRITLLEYLNSINHNMPWIKGKYAFDAHVDEIYDSVVSGVEGLYDINNLIEYFKWYKSIENSAELNDLLVSAYEWLRTKAKFRNVHKGNPECYQLLFDEFILSKDTSTDFLSALIRLNSSVNLAHLALAGILRDFPEWGDTVYTTNFDDLLLKALLQLNKSARVFGEYDSSTKPSMSPNYPQIIHLHGKFTGYGLKNTESEISYFKPVLQEAFKEHISDSNLIIVGYSGWDDLVMKTLLEWKESPELIRGSLYWVPYLNTDTMLPDVLTFLNSLPYSNQINIILSDDVLQQKSGAIGLNADYFMVKMCNFINRKKSGFLPFRQEIVSNAENQHSFILEELAKYPEFSPDRIFEILDEALKILHEADKVNQFNKLMRRSMSIARADDLPSLIRAKAYLKIGEIYYNKSLPDLSIHMFKQASSLARVEDRTDIEAKVVRINALIGQGKGNLKLSEFDSAHECISKAYVRAKSIKKDFPELLAHVNYNYLFMRLLKGYPLDKPVREMLQHVNESNLSKIWHVRINILRAIKKMSTSSYSAAESYLNDNAELFKLIEDVKIDDEIRNNIALLKCYISQRKIDASEKLSVKLESLLDASYNLTYKSNFHETLAWFHYSQGNFEKFQIEISRAYEYAYMEDSFYNMSDICFDAAKASEETKDFPKMKYWYEQLARIPKRLWTTRIVHQYDYNSNRSSKNKFDEEE